MNNVTELYQTRLSISSETLAGKGRATPRADENYGEVCGEGRLPVICADTIGGEPTAGAGSLEPILRFGRTAGLCGPAKCVGKRRPHVVIGQRPPP